MKGLPSFMTTLYRRPIVTHYWRPASLLVIRGCQSACWLSSVNTYGASGGYLIILHLCQRKKEKHSFYIRSLSPHGGEREKKTNNNMPRHASSVVANGNISGAMRSGFIICVWKGTDLAKQELWTFFLRKQRAKKRISTCVCVCLRTDLLAVSDVSAPFVQGPYTRLVCVLRQPGVSLTHRPAWPRVCRRGGTNLNPWPRGYAFKSCESHNYVKQKYLYKSVLIIDICLLLCYIIL